MESVRQFRKRNTILSSLQQSKAHPSAEALYHSLRQEHPDITLATVYRNLALFKSQGLIRSLGTVSGVERFDGDLSPHAHFVCRGCSAVLDLPEAQLPDLCQAADGIGCQVEQTQLVLYGLCPDCVSASSPEEN